MIKCWYGNIVNFSCTSRIHFCLKIHSKTPFKPMRKKNSQNLPFPLGNGPSSNAPMPEPTLLTTQTTARSIHELSHNYATKSFLVTMGLPKFTPPQKKIASSLWAISTLSHTPIHRPTALTTPNGIQIQSAVFPQFTHRTDTQTDRQTHRLTDRIGDEPVPIPAYALLHYSDAAKNAITC